jgi:hypothetical protein
MVKRRCVERRYYFAPASDAEGQRCPDCGAMQLPRPDRRHDQPHQRRQQRGLHRHDNWRSQIVHEAVHAVFGPRKQQPPNEIDEAAAYLGETVWFRAGGLGRVVGANNKLRGTAGKV